VDSGVFYYFEVDFNLNLSMKKLYLCVLCCSICFSAVYGQDTLKVGIGKFTTELNINPFEGELSLNNALNQIKVRYFFAGNSALRMGLTYNSKKTKSESSNSYGTNPYSREDERKTATVGLNFGAEKHFSGTRRLSPYLGAELVVASKSSSQTLTSTSQSTTPATTETEVKGAWQTVTIVNNNVFVSSYEERGFFQYGLNLVGGFDFYIAKNLYLGYEVAYALLKTKYKTIEVTTTPAANNSVPDSSQEDFTLGPNLINGIRFGFVF
jgi:hypothetical protein